MTNIYCKMYWYAKSSQCRKLLTFKFKFTFSLPGLIYQSSNKYIKVRILNTGQRSQR